MLNEGFPDDDRPLGEVARKEGAEEEVEVVKEKTVGQESSKVEVEREEERRAMKVKANVSNDLLHQIQQSNPLNRKCEAKHKTDLVEGIESESELYINSLNGSGTHTKKVEDESKDTVGKGRVTKSSVSALLEGAGLDEEVGAGGGVQVATTTPKAED